jgi:hypothetical protein
MSTRTEAMWFLERVVRIRCGDDTGEELRCRYWRSELERECNCRGRVHRPALDARVSGPCQEGVTAAALTQIVTCFQASGRCAAVEGNACYGLARCACLWACGRCEAHC